MNSLYVLPVMCNVLLNYKNLILSVQSLYLALEAVFLLNEYTTHICHCFIFLLVLNTKCKTFIIFRSNFSTDFYIKIKEMETVNTSRTLFLKVQGTVKWEHISLYNLN